MCANSRQPAAPLPANVSLTREFNEKLGLGIKYLLGWRDGQRIPCANLVDYATSLQIMVHIYTRETGEILRSTIRDRWIAWAGPPENLMLDPAAPNTSELLADFCNGQGITVHQTVAEAHWQLGKVERHGQWFQRILLKVLDEVRPTTQEEYETCLTQVASAKNSLMMEVGASPYQLVLGLRCL